ncbi:hypothetical protein Bca52824_034467 [Brassica carinata]|uniref:F-box domain-containing protein n=1 Tax=Brassica carinata TaxID=52824 RepID=A0A8X7S0Z1_BRACI|nr:hypothetical protein Bca52824_034467 [Brassica carinata]
MAVISEITDDDNVDKKPHQELPEETRITTTTRRCSLESVPLDVTERIVASFSRYEYPAIALVSSHFRRLIASHNFRLTRSQLSVPERFLYALLGFPPHQLPRWYILYRSSSNASLRLRRVDSLPPVPYGCTVVAVGREIYVFGGCDGRQRYTSAVTLIDCMSHTSRSLSRMREARYRASAGVIDGKIFVVGGCETPSSNWVEAFDLERRVWVKSCSFVDTWAGGHALRGLWQASSCVVDGMLFNVDPGRSLGHLIIVFDLKKQVWRPVKLDGVHGLPPCIFQYGYESKMGNIGGKLVILVGDQTQWRDYEGEKSIWCVEIALRRRQGGEIRGKVESVDVVFKTTKSTPSIELCRTVIV